VALQIAVSRDMLNWIGGLWCCVVTAAAAVTIKTKQFPKLMAAPIFIATFYGAFVWDMAYNTKSNRIKQYYEEVKLDSNYWFNPIDAPFQQQQQQQQEQTPKKE